MHYGTDPEDLSQTVKSPIRLNRTHAETIFRVRMMGLQPQTTYYYKVTSMGVLVRVMGSRVPCNTSPQPLLVR